MVLLGFAGMSVTASGCGSGTAPSTSTSPTRAQFVTQADRVCQRQRARETPLGERARAALALNPPDTQRAADAYQQLAILLRQSATQLRAIPAPAVDAGATAQLVADIDAEGTAMGTVADGVRQTDQSTAETAIAEIKTHAAELKGLAQGLGLRVCGKADVGTGA